MNILKFFGLKQDRFLGISTGKRRYDLPLDRNAGNKFIKMLVCLMTVLLILSFSGAFVLSGIAKNWSSGLEGKASVEVAAVDENGVLINQQDVIRQTDAIAKSLNQMSIVTEARVLSEKEILELIQPWLGDNLDIKTTPLPGVISVSFQQFADIDYALLKDRIEAIAPQAKLDTHDSWLTDILKLTGSLQFAASVIILVIGLTTIIAIAGAVRTRLSAYKDDLELLHLMGAGDNYISGQFQKHTMILALQGSLIGLIIGAFLLVIIGFLLSNNSADLLPTFTLTKNQALFLCLLPAIIGFLSMLTARFTVLRTLAQLP